MFDALRTLGARISPWDWIMDHRLKFGTVAACVLAVPLGVSVFHATQQRSYHVPTDRVDTLAEGVIDVGKDKLLRLFGDEASTEQTVANVPTEVRADRRREQAEIVEAEPRQKPETMVPVERDIIAAKPAPAPKAEIGRSQDQDGETLKSIQSQVDAVPAMQSPTKLPVESKKQDVRSRDQQRIKLGLKGNAASLNGTSVSRAARLAPTISANEAEAVSSGRRHAEPKPAPVLQQPADQKYESVKSNPLKIVADEPVSTFSIDVDTASYAQVRRELEQGSMPVPGSVRVEEMINYFSYDYAGPDSLDAPFRPNVALYPTPWNKQTKLLHIGIKGADIAAAARPRANLVFLIDTSGSMNGPDRLPLLQTAFRLLVQELDENDTVSIVTYAGQAGTVLEPTKASNRREIINAITNLRSGGSTAGAAGIKQAYALAEQAFDKDGVNRVILATDGDFNVGMTDQDQLKGYIAEKRKSGVFLSVLGFGRGNYKDGLMQTLAQNGNGNAAYIDSLKEAEKVLVTEATSTLFPIAKDVKIQIEFNPATVSAYRLIGYETRMLRRQDFNNDKIDAGDIGSGHTVTALYEITPVGSASKPVDDLRYQQSEKVDVQASSDEYAYLKLRYKKPNGSTSKLIQQPITSTSELASIDTASNDVRFAAAVAAFGQKLRGATDTQDMSYAAIQDLAMSARGADRFGFRSEFIDLVRMAKLLTPMDLGTSGTQPK